MRRHLLVVAAALLLAGCVRRAGEQAAKPVAPAKVEPAGKREADLATITLTEDAERRLGIRTAAVAREKVGRVRRLGGVAAPPPGAVIAASAPLAGEVGAPPGGAVPRPGEAVKKGQAVLSLLPLIPPEARVGLLGARVEADGAVEKAKVEVEAARTAHGRAEELLREKAGSQRALDEARAALRLAEASLAAGISRKEMLARAVLDWESGKIAPVPIEAPLDGLLRALHAAPGQKVPAGAALFEVLASDRLWVRVPVYVGDLAGVDAEKEARVGDLSGAAGAPSRAARPLAAPPSADPDAATADLFYEIDNRDGAFRPGQRVGVTLPLRAGEESLVAPWSAVIHDIHGGAWVYERVEPRRFVRRRVQVRHLDGARAVLAEGPRPGTEVVIEGAAELFGTEFGVGK